MGEKLPQKWESKFREDFAKTVPNSLVIRLYNNMGGFINISNYCDFICYDGNRMYMIDCKTCSGASFPIINFSQYNSLISVKNIPNLITGVALWLYEKDIICFIPTYTFEKAKKNGLKSINPKTIDRNIYYIVDIPSVKLRTFFNSDWSILKNVPDYLTYIQGEQK